jgi:hypothetical protein
MPENGIDLPTGTNLKTFFDETNTKFTLYTD